MAIVPGCRSAVLTFTALAEERLKDEASIGTCKKGGANNMVSSFVGYVCQNPLTSWRSILGYTLIIEHSNGELFTLSEVAGSIWRNASTWVHTDQLIRALQNEYNVDEKTAREDTLSFVQQLISVSLLMTSPPLEKAKLSKMHNLRESLPHLQERMPVEIKNLCEVEKIPIVSYLELTRKCNLRCIHCYNGGSFQHELTIGQIKDVLDDLVDLGCLDLVLTGGEPCIHKDFEDVLWYARDKRFCVTLKTNGTLLDEGTALLLKKTLVSEIHISLYSLKPEEHEAITMVEGSLAKTLNGIDCLLREGLKVRLSTPITKLNYLSVREIGQFAERINAGCGFDPIITAQVDGSRKPVELRIGEPEWQELLDEGLLSEVIYPNTVNLNDSSSIQSGATNSSANNELLCGAGTSSVAITALGDVLPCICLPTRIGNVMESSLKRIWTNEEAWSSVRTLTRKLFTECTDCNHLDYCPRCPGVIFSETGKMVGAAPVICTTAAFLERSRKYSVLKKGGEGE
jgi:radical SAM protein with 4Fe4S-binding SPASM domain